MKFYSAFLAIGGLIFLTLLTTSWVSAQVVDSLWTQPYQLSSETGQADDQVMFADQFGNVHVFWPETGVIEHHTIIQYSRFDGETWSPPVDIHVSPYNETVESIAATVDNNGTLHLLFTNWYYGSAYYTQVPIQDATSAQSWQKPVQLDFSVRNMVVKADSEGVLHLLYTGLAENEPGIFYTSSSDQGQTWSDPVWLDPDIPIDLRPGVIQLEIGEGDSLHAAWHYIDQSLLGQWVRYSHSFDHGQNWSIPFTIDDVEAGSDELRLPYPSLAVNGEIVHVIWAGDRLTRRKHRMSSDSGITWSEKEFIFGDLHGQALGDGVALDSLGRPHFFGQIRWPQGVYHAYWDEGRWSLPSIIYLIAQDAFDPIGERIHAHRVRSAIRAGNQIVVTFTTNPSAPRSILYAMQATLQDVPVLTAQPLPSPTPLPTPHSELTPASPTPLPVTTIQTPSFDITLEPAPSRLNTPSSGLVWGLVPVILLIAGVVTFRLLFKRLS